MSTDSTSTIMSEAELFAEAQRVILTKPNRRSCYAIDGSSYMYWEWYIANDKATPHNGIVRVHLRSEGCHIPTSTDGAKWMRPGEGVLLHHCYGRERRINLKFRGADAIGYNFDAVPGPVPRLSVFLKSAFSLSEILA